MTKRRIAILSFSFIYRDARVLRQIEYARNEYDVTVIGYGDWKPPWPSIQYYQIKPAKRTLFRSLCRALFLFAGFIFHDLWINAYWLIPDYKKAYEFLIKRPFEIIHANDLTSLPVAVSVTKQTGVKVLYDAHEYSLDQEKDYKYGKLLRIAQQRHLLKSFLSRVDAFITVSNGIAELYREVLGVLAMVIMNAPRPSDAQFRSVDPLNIRLIHHGGVTRGRGLERLIMMMPHLDERYSLHFILIGPNSVYRMELISLADSVAHERIFFHDAVPSVEVVRTISEYDIGVYILPTTILNHKYALPNKFFDFIAAGLAVAIGPSPEMARILKQYKFGVVGQGFKPHDLADALNTLSPGEINLMKRNAIVASKTLNADIEMGKLLSLYHDLLN